MDFETDIWTGPGRAAVFLDRDGTVNQEVQYLSKPEQMKLMPRAGQAIARLNQAKLPVIIVTNQSGIARGYYSEDDLHAIHARMDELLAEHGASVTAYYYCPHHPQAKIEQYRVDCECRKPRTGMLFAAAAQENVALGQSYLVGDKRSDLDAAHHAGCQPILVRTGYGTRAEAGLRREAAEYVRDVRETIVNDLSAAVDHILLSSSTPPQGEKIKPPKFMATFAYPRPGIGRYRPQA